MTRCGSLTTVRTMPFLRWAGGKSKFVHQIVSRLPLARPEATYYEPFLAAGAVFLAYVPQRACLSDFSSHLVDTFSAVRDHPAEVASKLHALHSRDSEEAYSRIRDQFNKRGRPCLQAARLIYLNQTSFNGIYRVNRRGEYNVPYGFKANPKVPGKEALESASRILKGTTFMMADYKQALGNALRGDVVYLDPPFPPLNGHPTLLTIPRSVFQPKTKWKSLASLQSCEREAAL